MDSARTLAQFEGLWLPDSEIVDPMRMPLSVLERNPRFTAVDHLNRRLWGRPRQGRVGILRPRRLVVMPPGPGTRTEVSIGPRLKIPTPRGSIYANHRRGKPTSWWPRIPFLYGEKKTRFP